LRVKVKNDIILAKEGAIVGIISLMGRKKVHKNGSISAKRHVVIKAMNITNILFLIY